MSSILTLMGAGGGPEDEATTLPPTTLPDTTLPPTTLPPTTLADTTLPPTTLPPTTLPGPPAILSYKYYAYTRYLFDPYASCPGGTPAQTMPFSCRAGDLILNEVDAFSVCKQHGGDDYGYYAVYASGPWNDDACTIPG